MKQLFLSLLAVVALTACNNGNKQSKATEASQTVETKQKVIAVDDLLANAENLVDKTIFLKGDVTHTCKHSGRRCFLAGTTEDLTIRVEAGGKINGFNRELIGSEIIVEGVLKENRISEEEIKQYEEKLKESGKLPEEDGSAETCSAERNNINKMRAWMKDHGKPYYASYYVNGIDFEQGE